MDNLRFPPRRNGGPGADSSCPAAPSGPTANPPPETFRDRLLRWAATAVGLLAGLALLAAALLSCLAVLLLALAWLAHSWRTLTG
jgi:hypothetical protein